MMATVRQIALVQRGTPTIEGAGVHLRRAFGLHEVERFDPFLLLDDFGYESIGMNYFELDRPCLFDSRHLIVYGAGDALEITTTDTPVRFLLFAGKPIHEPIAWYGPIVVNTQEELRVAFEEYRNGTFIRT